jgi:hypothetical protein
VKKKRQPDLRKIRQTLAPQITRFAEAGIPLRIEYGEFKSNKCWLNGELQVFINRRMVLEDQQRFLDNLWDDEEIVARIGQLKEDDDAYR